MWSDCFAAEVEVVLFELVGVELDNVVVDGAGRFDDLLVGRLGDCYVAAGGWYDGR